MFFLLFDVKSHTSNVFSDEEVIAIIYLLFKHCRFMLPDRDEIEIKSEHRP